MAPIILSDAVGPDTLIRVFNQEFHVHSTVLKIQCEFFKLFMDSPDKVAGTSTNPRFNYEWATKVDADGDWSLVSAVTLKAEEDVICHVLRPRLSLMRCRKPKPKVLLF